MAQFVFIPASISIDQLIQEAPEGLRERLNPDKLATVLSLCTPPPWKQEPQWRIGATRSSRSFRKFVGNAYKIHRDYLVERRVIQKTSGYIVGEASETYSLISEYKGANKPYEISSIPISKRIAAERTEKIKELDHDTRYLTKWFTDGKLDIEFEAALAELEKISWDSIRAIEGEAGMLKKYNGSLWGIHQLHDKLPSLTIDDTVGRFHSPITGLKSELRKFVTYNDQPIVSFDIANAQSFFLSVLIDPNLAKEANYTTSFLESFAHSFPPSSSLHYMFTKVIQNEHNEDFTLFRNLSLSGRIYEHLENVIVPTEREGQLSRKQLKQIIFRTFFSDPAMASRINSTANQRFHDTFPSIYEIILAAKTDNYKAFPRLLMRLESSIIIKEIALNFASNHPRIPLFTIHDNIATIVQYESILAEFVRQEFQSLVGHVPPLHREPWSD